MIKDGDHPGIVCQSANARKEPEPKIFEEWSLVVNEVKKRSASEEIVLRMAAG